MLLAESAGYWNPELNWRNPARFTGLRYAAYFGMVEIVVALIDMKKWDL